jgi:hypothetical protein
MLGHAKASMTLDVYADLFDEDSDTVAVNLDAAIRPAAYRSSERRQLANPTDPVYVGRQDSFFRPTRRGPAAYARKMEPHPEETADFSAFSKMRRIPLDPESVIGRELLDGFADFDESFTGHNRIWAVVVKLVGLTAMCSKAVIDLEKQVIELRRELRSRDKA